MLFGNSRGERLNLVFEFGSGHIILGMSPRIPKEPFFMLEQSLFGGRRGSSLRLLARAFTCCLTF